MSTTFDFGDGPVPAHQHPNGGGWVADTADVDDGAFVDSNARVYGGAQVYGDARVYGGAQVYGDAWVYGNAQVCYGELTCAPVTATRSDGYTFTLQPDGTRIVAGCRYFDLAKARVHWGNPAHHKHKESIAIFDALLAMNAARHDGATKGD